jgi:hypothetical protein
MDELIGISLDCLCGCEIEFGELENRITQKLIEARRIS